MLPPPLSPAVSHARLCSPQQLQQQQVLLWVLANAQSPTGCSSKQGLRQQPGCPPWQAGGRATYRYPRLQRRARAVTAPSSPPAPPRCRLGNAKAGLLRCLQGMRALTRLCLAHSDLHRLPPELSALDRLHTLILDGNPVLGENPAAKLRPLTAIPSLARASLTDCQLAGWPPALPRPPNLQVGRGPSAGVGRKCWDAPGISGCSSRSV